MINRIRSLQIAFILWSLILLIRLFYWQVLNSNDLKNQGLLQTGRSEQIPASRGVIYSNDGSIFIGNLEKYRLFIDPHTLPKNTSDLEKILSTLPASASALTNLSEAKKSDTSWFSIVGGISASTKLAIDSLNIPGAGFDPQPERIYPEGTPSAYLTGFIGKDKDGQDTGYFGLEGFFNRQLTGIPGRRISQADALGLPILFGTNAFIRPQDGQTLTTSIDRTILHIAYEKLQSGVDRYQADSGTVTILDTQTGQVLALVSVPGYDQKKYAEVPSELLKNPIVAESYEPGSTFKTLVMASALDSGVVTPSTICTACSGPVTISGKTIRNYDDKYTANSNMYDIILHSDNVGMVFVGKLLGQSKLINYYKKFGLGQLTGVELQEESIPPLRNDTDWHELDLATSAFGQGIAMTRLQLVAAVNALANKGKYIAPRLVTQVVDNNKKISPPPPLNLQVVSAQAAQKVTDMMVNGVKNGAVNIHRPKGFLIAGKTGTAQVPIEGHYDPDKTIASFIGFAPADKPKFTMLVTISNPRTSPWGSTTAAPIWFAIAVDLFRYYHIPATPGL